MTSIKILAETIVDENGSIPLLDLIQIGHKFNKFKKAFGISIRYNEVGTPQTYFETNCANLANSICANFPSAQVVYIEPTKESA
jgi:hypothetical protein